MLEKGGGKQGSVPCLVSSMQRRYGLQVVQQGPEVKLCLWCVCNPEDNLECHLLASVETKTTRGSVGH